MKRKDPGPEVRQQWLEHVAARKKSGESRAAYCRKHGLSYHQMRDWEGRNGKGPKLRDRPATAAFVRVERAPSARSGMLRVTLPGGVGLEVADGFDIGQVARLVTAIGGLR